MLSPTQQSYALIAAHTALFTAGGVLCGYLSSKLNKTRNSKDNNKPDYISFVLTAGACTAIAYFTLTSHEQIWRSACLCDSATPGAKKYIIEYIGEHARSLGTRTFYALSSDLFNKYVDNEDFYRSCSIGFSLFAYLIPGVAAHLYFDAKRE